VAKALARATARATALTLPLRAREEVLD